MIWKQQMFISFITGFGATSGAMSALGIGSAIARCVFLSFFRKNDNILDSKRNIEVKQKDNRAGLDTQAETESVYDSEQSNDVQPYQSETADYFDCNKRYGESYDFKKMATPVTEAYQDAFLQRNTI